jgi:hypothetical protein
MNVRYEAAFRAPHCDPTASVGSWLPGRQLAEYLAGRLQATDLGSVEVVDEEPFWVVRVPGESGPIDVLVYIYLPSEDPEDAVWSVCVPCQLGFFDRLLGRQERPQIVALLEAIHRALQTEGGIRDVRWFKELPANPYRTSKFGNVPVTSG